MDPDRDSDPGLLFFFHWPSRRREKTNLKKVFCLLLFEGTFTLFFKDKKSKRSHKTVVFIGFSYYFCLMIEGSGSGSGSRRPQNIRMRQIWIRNTALRRTRDRNFRADCSKWFLVDFQCCNICEKVWWAEVTLFCSSLYTFIHIYS